jgi:hypothetical protein
MVSQFKFYIMKSVLILQKVVKSYFHRKILNIMGILHNSGHSDHL